MLYVVFALLALWKPLNMPDCRSWATMSVFTSLCRRLAFERLPRLRNGTAALSSFPVSLHVRYTFNAFFSPLCYPWAKLFSSCLLTSSPLSQDLLCLKIRSPSTVRMVLPHRGSVCFMFRWHRSGQCAWCYIYIVRESLRMVVPNLHHINHIMFNIYLPYSVII